MSQAVTDPAPPSEAQAPASSPGRESFPPDGLPWREMAFPSTEHALKDYLRKR